jgi:hypothetical protein
MSILTNTPPEPLYWWPTGATVQFYEKLGITHIKLEMPKHEFNHWVLGQRTSKPADISFEEWHLGKPFVSREDIERATLTPIQAEGVKGGHCPKCDTLYITELPITMEDEQPAFHMNSTGDVAVADDYFTRDDFENCPKNTKVYLIGAGGVGTLAHYDGDPFWVEWAPLPKRKGSK